jgi:outer membrane protein
MNRKMRSAALAATILVCAGTLGAQTPEPGRAAAGAIPLRDAVARAVNNSRELQLARAQAAVADNAAGALRAQFRPNLYTGSGAAATRGMPQSPGGQAPAALDVSFIQTLLNGPQRGELRAAEERARIRRLDFDRKRDEVVVETASAYLELASVRSALELLIRERASAARILEVVRARAGEGLELPVEVTRAELLAARIEQRVLSLEGREETLETRLRSLMGLPPDVRVEVAREPLPLDPARPVGELVALALATSPELQQAEHERRAREHRLRGERNGRWPSLDLVGQYAVLTRFNNYDEFFNRFERHNVTAGVRIRIPIYSARTGAMVRLAESELSASSIEARIQREAIETEVRRLARSTRELDAAQTVARLELRLAQEDLRVLQAQFDEGRAGLRELEQARLAEHDRWRAFLDAEHARQTAELELLRRTGELSRLFP